MPGMLALSNDESCPDCGFRDCICSESEDEDFER